MSTALFPTPSLTVTDFANSLNLANWIARHTPCYAGDVPIAQTMALLELFERHRVPTSVVKLAFEILAAQGMPFELPFHLRSTTAAPARNTSSAPQMRAISEGEKKRFEEYGLEEMERRFVLAIRTNNAAGAEAMLAAAINLLLGLAKGYGKTRQARSQINEKLQEWEEFNMAVDQAMDRARMLQSHIRQITREELNEMRRSPTPDALRRVTQRVTTRINRTNSNNSRRTRK